jgi:2',3'-cyclic-nucleotide 2'-phosphodiesterase (5'-nucleotidase family)
LIQRQAQNNYRNFSDLIRSGSGNPGTNFPYLSTNLDFTTDENLRSLVASNSTTAEASTLKNRIAKSTVITVAGNDGQTGTQDDQRIGIVGATTPTLRSISSPGTVGVLPANATDYDALAAEIQKTVDTLTNTGINKVILLAHMQQLNIERDELARRLKGVDVIIAGGSHTPVLDANDAARTDGGNTPQQGYPFVQTGADGQPVLVVNTDANYRYVGRLVLEFSDTGIVNTNSLNPTLNGSFSTDEAGVDRVYGSDVDARTLANQNVVAITDSLRNAISSKDSNITGKTNFFLNGTRSDVRTQETNLGSLSADANLDYAKQIDSSTVISLKNGGGIRDNIGVVSASGGATNANEIQKLPPQANSLAPNKPTGGVSQLDIENSLRFNNTLSLVTVTSAQLKELLEHGVAETETGATPGRFPQLGGMIFSFDPTRAAAEDLDGDGVLDTGEDKNGNGVLDAGQRVRSIALINDKNKVTEVVVQDGAVVGDANRTFRMVTLNFLASGGDSYPFKRFTEANPTLANRVDLIKTGVKDSKATFADTGSEQDALAEYLLKIGTYNQQDTDARQDFRIQNLALRRDSVLTAGRQITGRSRKETLTGTIGDDIITGLGGADTIRSFEGNDDVNGGKGNDILDAAEGDDILRGGAGEDIARGGNGADTILCGTGDDIAIGGNDNDIFALGKGRGDVVIRDFKDRVDKLSLLGGGRFNGLSIEDMGNSTMISRGNDVMAILRGVDASDITRADFVRVTV